jgi:mRNA interferase RelE/StbE
VASYRVLISPGAERRLGKLPREMQKRISTVISALSSDPRPDGVVRLSGPSGAWRIRVGVYRVVYTIEDDRLLILVVKIGPRRDVYRGM